MLKSFLVFVCCFFLSNAFYLYGEDPCLFSSCNFGEICVRSIDGLSYNCIQEDATGNMLTSVNVPLNYFVKYHEPNPCLSSPCNEKEVCRVFKRNKYVCVKELELPNDIANHLPITLDNIFSRPSGVLKRLKAKFPKKKVQKEEDDDDDEKESEKDEDHDQDEDENEKEDDNIDQVKTTTELTRLDNTKKPIGLACQNQTNGKRLVNPLNSRTYIECFNQNEVVKTCLFNLVFNSHIEKCSKTQEKPTSCSPNPCLNGARCNEISDTEYKCECKLGFTGENCELKDVCKPTYCGNKGVCLSVGYASPISHLCWCSKGQYLGLDCNKNLESNPCLAYDSKNKKFPLKLNPAVYVICDGTRPQVKFCQHPLVYSESTGECDWPEYKKRK